MADLHLCYIAGPFSDPSETIRAWHVDRARLLARLALACGYAPFEPHSSIHAGVYGDDSDPEQRARGMAATAAICRGVLSTPGAVLWALWKDDGTLSEGTRSEVAIAAERGDGVSVASWDGWRMRAEREAPDLLPEWDRLANRPDAVGEWQGPFAEGTAWFRWYPDGDTRAAAAVYHQGWIVRTVDGDLIAQGPETGALGRTAADAALRRAGVMA